MAKPLFQDIVPPEKKSIKKIPIPERGKDRRAPVEETPRVRSAEPAPRFERPERSEERPARPRHKRRNKTPVVLTLLALAIIGGLVFMFVPKVSGSNITITPRGQEVAVDSQYTAYKDVNAELPYQVAVYEKDGKLTLAATEDEFAETKASGVIRIFNNYSSAPQKLVANTRFQAPDGQIFRISQPVTVPGKAGDTAGSVDVAVTAEKVGAEYNVGLTDFTIPGFKGDPKYDKIYARSKTEITGGFQGTRKKVNPEQVTQARQKIRDELEVILVKQMQQNIPENFAFVPGAYFIEYQTRQDEQVTGGVQLNERATFHGFMFKRSDLAHAIAQKSTGTSTNLDDIHGLDSLKFSVKTGSNNKVWESDTFVFSLNGTTTLISSIDTDKLKDDLAGKPRKSLSAILAGYPEVAEANVVMRPFWKQSFPVNKSEISITIQKPGEPSKQASQEALPQ